MDLIISGMALSYRWCPSLHQFEESLIGKRTPTPALVEHAGEIIYQALIDAKLEPGSHLTIIRDFDKVELGHYLPLIKGEIDQVNQVKPASQALGDQITQAYRLIKDNNQHHVLICDNSRSGTSAVVFSHAGHEGQKLARLRRSLDSGVDLSQADYVEITGAALAVVEQNSNRIKALFASSEPYHPVAVGQYATPGSRSVEILNLIQAVLAVGNKIIPASGYTPDSFPAEFSKDPLYINQQYRPWLSRGRDFIRSAIFICEYTHNPGDMFLLEEIKLPTQQIKVRTVSGSDPYLFLLSGETQKELLDKIDDLENRLLNTGALVDISSDTYVQFSRSNKPFTCCLLGKNREELKKELVFAKLGIKDAFHSGKAWNSPNGSYFTAQPLGDQGITFVYPGAFNSYPGMGRDLFFSFSGLHDAVQELVPDPSHSLAEDFLYIRSSRSGIKSTDDPIMTEFFQHPNQLIESGISFSLLLTQILDQVFNLKPDITFGYSLGEVSMLWANRIWQNAEESSNSWKQSSLFKDQLVGKMKAVRRHWSDHKFPPNFWKSYILKAEYQKAHQACEREPLVYLTIKNTSTEVVISGEKEACQRVIMDLDCHALPMPFNTVIHNPTMDSTYQAFTELYTNQTNPNPGIRFFSAADYQELSLNESSLAESMARMTCNQVDFPKLVNEVYDSGARIFLEVGPQKTCSRWIEKILKNKPHAVIPLNKKYQPDFHGILKVISLLLSNGVGLNLEPLFPDLARLSTKEAVEESSDLPINPQTQISPAELNIPAMESKSPNFSKDYFSHLERISSDMGRSHQEYLNQQQTLTRNLVRVMEIQAGAQPKTKLKQYKAEYLYSRKQIEAFTSGDHRECFGDSFSGFGERRIPRLPNGELQFIDRVLTIEGEPKQIREGSALTSEFVLPDMSWFRNGITTSLPPVSVMEIALQPCGFLSAYMGSIIGRESQDLYFRNLDGEGIVIGWPDSGDEVITNHVKLLSSNSLEDVIIQNYAFELFWGNKPFYKGASSFGYFPSAMLANQVGLDGDQHRSIWFKENPRAGIWKEKKPKSKNSQINSRAHLPEIDRLWISESGGSNSRGYIYLEQKIPADAWFYKAHFYQDPVMPGSLGVEIMARALTAAVDTWGLPAGLNWRMSTGTKTSWKYRGQITPDIREIQIDLHLTDLIQTTNGWKIIADGHLWKDNKRIYQVKDLSLESY